MKDNRPSADNRPISAIPSLSDNRFGFLNSSPTTKGVVTATSAHNIASRVRFLSEKLGGAAVVAGKTNNVAGHAILTEAQGLTKRCIDTIEAIAAAADKPNHPRPR